MSTDTPWVLPPMPCTRPDEFGEVVPAKAYWDLRELATKMQSTLSETNATGPRATIVPTTNAARPRPDSNACGPEVSGGSSAAVAAPLSAMNAPDLIISKIIGDIRSRRGLSEEWDCINVDIRNEIVAEWRGFFHV